MDYKKKYLKYKLKYLTAKKLYGGSGDGNMNDQGSPSLDDSILEDLYINDEILKLGRDINDEMLKLGINIIDNNIYKFFNSDIILHHIKYIGNNLYTARFPMKGNNDMFYQLPNTDLESLKENIINLFTSGHIEYDSKDGFYIDKLPKKS